jgi:hypothetical protein
MKEEQFGEIQIARRRHRVQIESERAPECRRSKDRGVLSRPSYLHFIRATVAAPRIRLDIRETHDGT